MFILRLWWKTIICVPWAIFSYWPTSERSVFDMPAVLGKKGQDGGRASAPFPYRSSIRSMGSDRPHWNAIQQILYKRDGKSKEDLMEWQSKKERRLKRENADEIEVWMAQMSHHMCSFSTLSSPLLFRMSLFHFLVFSAHTVLTKTTEVSQSKRSVYDISILLHTLYWLNVNILPLPPFSQFGCIFCAFFSGWLQKHMCEECLIELLCGSLMDCSLSLNVGAARQRPVDVLKCGCLKELSALWAPGQVMEREADCIRTYVMSLIWNQIRGIKILHFCKYLKNLFVNQDL